MTAAISSLEAVETLLSTRQGPYLKAWANWKDRTVCVLSNGDFGWLMVLRSARGAGRTTFDASCAPGKELPSLLGKEQLDHDLHSLCHSVRMLHQAIGHFRQTGDAEATLAWKEQP